MDYDPDDPAPLALALDEPADYTVGPGKYLKGPLLVVGMSAASVVEILDGPPFEAGSATVCKVTERALPPGGILVGPDGYVVAEAAVTIRAVFPQPYTVRVSKLHTTEDHPPPKICRMLERGGAEIVEGPEASPSAGSFAATISVPFNSRDGIADYLRVADIDATQLGGQAHLPPEF